LFVAITFQGKEVRGQGHKVNLLRSVGLRCVVWAYDLIRKRKWHGQFKFGTAVVRKDCNTPCD